MSLTITQLERPGAGLLQHPTDIPFLGLWEFPAGVLTWDVGEYHLIGNVMPPSPALTPSTASSHHVVN